MKLGSRIWWSLVAVGTALFCYRGLSGTGPGEGVNLPGVMGCSAAAILGWVAGGEDERR